MGKTFLVFTKLVTDCGNQLCHIEKNRNLETDEKTGTGVTPMTSGSQITITLYDRSIGSQLINCLKTDKKFDAHSLFVYVFCFVLFNRREGPQHIRLY